MDIKKFKIEKERALALSEKNKDVFKENFIPKEIKYRDQQISTIIKEITANYHCYLIGGVGTGKTIAILWVIHNFEKTQNNKGKTYIYQSCKGLNLYDVWNGICSKLSIEVGKKQSPGTYNTAIQEYAKSNNIDKIVIVLDEVDTLILHYRDPDLLYNFGNSSLYTVVLVGNSFDWINEIGIRTADRLIGIKVMFPFYQRHELEGILVQRSNLCTTENIIFRDEIAFIAEAILTNEKYTLREGISVISKLYDYKKINNINEIIPSIKISKFFEQVKNDSVIAIYSSLSPILRYTIVCITKMVENRQKKSFSIPELTSFFNSHSDNKISNKSVQSIRRYLNELETYGFIISTYKGRKGVSSYQKVYIPKFDIEEFALYFRTEMIFKEVL